MPQPPAVHRKGASVASSGIREYLMMAVATSVVLFVTFDRYEPGGKGAPGDMTGVVNAASEEDAADADNRASWVVKAIDAKRAGGGGTASEEEMLVVQPPPPPVAAADVPATPPGKCEESMRHGADTGEYLLIPIIPQQFVSAVEQGLFRFLRTAVLAGRTAVIPQARFDEPGFRIQLPSQSYKGRSSYFSLCDLIDTEALLRPWSCLPRVPLAEWEAKTTATVDLLVIFTPAGSKSCSANYYKEGLKKHRRDGPYLGGGPDIKIVDTIQGRFTVKEVTCVPGDATKAQFKKALSGYKSVMISQPGQTFLQKGYSGICNGNVVTMPKVSSVWQAVGDSFISRFLSQPPPGWSPHKSIPAMSVSTGGHGCVHVRFEKLVRAILLKERQLPWKTLPNGQPHNERLESCLAGVIEMSTYMHAVSGGKLFMMHDMQDEFGTATVHFEGMSNAPAYKTWTTWAQKMMRERLPSYRYYCGSQEHKENTQQDDVVGHVLSSNARACALVEAAVCTRAKKKMRLGEGSFGYFVSNIGLGKKGRRNGPVEWGYSSCDSLLADVKACREKGHCTPVELRNATDFAPPARRSSSSGAVPPLRRISSSSVP